MSDDDIILHIVGGKVDPPMSVPEDIREEIRKQVFAELAAILNDRADTYEQQQEVEHRGYPCQIHELRMMANALRTWAEGVGSSPMQALRETKAAAREDRRALKKLAEYALHLRMYGEHAPGGNETWQRWDSMAENTLRNLKDKD